MNKFSIIENVIRQGIVNEARGYISVSECICKKASILQTARVFTDGRTQLLQKPIARISTSLNQILL